MPRPAASGFRPSRAARRGPGRLARGAAHGPWRPLAGGRGRRCIAAGPPSAGPTPGLARAGRPLGSGGGQADRAGREALRQPAQRLPGRGQRGVRASLAGRLRGGRAPLALPGRGAAGQAGVAASAALA
eukprot:615825-Lingulodinium_polyedra.AAC.1